MECHCPMQKVKGYISKETGIMSQVKGNSSEHICQRLHDKCLRSKVTGQRSQAKDDRSKVTGRGPDFYLYDTAVFECIFVQ